MHKQVTIIWHNLYHNIVIWCLPPLALHAPHPPPLQSLRIEQERVANLRAQEDRAAEEERAAAAADFAATAGGMDNPPPFTEAGTGAPPPVNNDVELIEQDRALSSMSLYFTQ